jgi:hypothetical protein
MAFYGRAAKREVSRLQQGFGERLKASTWPIVGFKMSQLSGGHLKTWLFELAAGRSTDIS